ncbi:MAG: hypothetical protein BGO05_01695 [Rhizobiales bacterium 63-7]|jgi:hypothetical protein|nr:hypothetical protein [Hyphomicrobiales bacterium]OJU70393.1 MAG: hypothetical protein BGO05_01695 [Rhizobiales bacterium 63-7]
MRIFEDLINSLTGGPGLIPVVIAACSLVIIAIVGFFLWFKLRIANVRKLQKATADYRAAIARLTHSSYFLTDASALAALEKVIEWDRETFEKYAAANQAFKKNFDLPGNKSVIRNANWFYRQIMDVAYLDGSYIVQKQSYEDAVNYQRKQNVWLENYIKKSEIDELKISGSIGEFIEKTKMVTK